MPSYYPDNLISEVIAANNIVDIVGSYVKLKKSGNRYMGLCPFHSEKTPSFHISEDKQLYHCFGCGEGGSVVQFVMKMENLDFVETVKFLAARAGINLPEGDERTSDGEYFAKKQKMLEMYVAAARFYHSCLKEEQGKTALSYLAARQFDGDTVARFGMGYSPASGDALYQKLKGDGYSEELMFDSGLVRKSDKNGKPYDFFRDRVMVPIFDIRGNVIAFGGRTMVKSDGRKYLNSGDSMIFNKSKVLYALNFAKKSCSEQILLVEGYMDAISLHMFGFTNAVAGLGTAFTADHAKLLARYTREVVLCYDSDDAGQTAVMRALEILQTTDLKLKVMTIPGAKDADEYLKLKGAAKFRELIDSAPNHILYKIDRLKKKYDLDNTEQKIAFLTDAAKVFSEVGNDIEREAYVKEASIITGISEDSIFTEINRFLHKSSQSKPVRSTYAKRSTEEEYDFLTEAYLLILMCGDITVWRKMREEVSAEFFRSPELAPVVSDIFSYSPDSTPPDFSLVISKTNPELSSKLSNIISTRPGCDNALGAALEMKSKLEKSAKERLIAAAAREGDPRKLAEMISNLKK